MNRFNFFLILVLLLCENSFAVNATEEKRASQCPGSGRTVKDQEHQAEVCLNHSKKKINVYLHKTPHTAPASMSITVFDKSRGNQTIELKAIQGKDYLPQYQGNLNPWMGSYVGFELKIPLPEGKEKKLVAEPHDLADEEAVLDEK